MNPQNENIKALLAAYLTSRNHRPAETFESHVDEDLLAAFSEGSLAARESAPVINHIADCTFCRHRSAELIRLNAEFAEFESEPQATTAPVEPGRISEVLSGLFSKIFGTSDQAVFAHEEKAEDQKEDETEETKEK